MIDTIIFDAEGVVVDSGQLWDIGQQKFLGDRGLVYDREKLLNADLVVDSYSQVDLSRF